MLAGFARRIRQHSIIGTPKAFGCGDVRSSVVPFCASTQILIQTSPAAKTSLPPVGSSYRFASNKAGVRRSVRKAARKGRALRLRQALEYAAQFDPLMVTHRQVRQTLKRAQWPVEEDFEISEGVSVPFALRDKYLAFDIALPEDYYPDTKVLKKEIMEQHAQARRKGWKVAVVDYQTWQEACKPPKQHVGRHMYLVELLASQLPIDDRR